MADRQTYRDRMRAANSFSSDLHATYGFVRLHLLGIFAPVLAIGFFLSGRTLTGVALAALCPALWIETAAEYGFERKLLTTVGMCCGTLAALLFIWATVLWWRAYLGDQPWPFP
jgi:hypothetical protein